jgi:hypothetical protein
MPSQVCYKRQAEGNLTDRGEKVVQGLKAETEVMLSQAKE